METIKKYELELICDVLDRMNIKELERTKDLVQSKINYKNCLNKADEYFKLKKQ